ncbi:MAG TPA: ATP-binding protein [Methylomirabilota bacterium]|jgi:signal transduction histidine kinase|nr:ATP-binding protein [Methylomirabilota bacterium]
MKLDRLFGGTVGLREAASIVFALVALLPLLLAVFVMHRSGALWTFEAQVAVLLALTVAVLGFVVFRMMVDRVARLAGALARPGGAARPADGGAIPGLGHVTEIGQIGDAFSRMLEDLRGSTERLEDLVFKLGALNEIVELAARVPNMQQLLALVLERTMRTVRATTGSIMLLERQRRVLRVVAARGDAGDVAVGTEVALGEGVAGRVAQAGEAALEDTVICLPIRVEERIIGVISLAKATRFSPTDVQFLSTLMTHVAYALENARLLEEARLSTERLQLVVQDLRTAQTRLVEGETVRALGQMASGMAHHLNNLLAVVSGRLQLLLLRANDPVLRKPLETAERAVGDAAEVVRRVLGFSAAQPVPETTRVDLNEIAADVIELTRPRWQDTAQLNRAVVDIRFEPGDEAVVAGEPAPLREVLMNLVLNALDAMPGGGCLTVRTWDADGWIYCAVGDTGTGMSADVRQRALEPFFTTKGPKGVGLGLSVSVGVVQRHRGEMDIKSAEGRGTEVTLRIPQPGVTPPPDTVPLTPPPVMPLTILIVDDEPTVLEALGDTLVEDGHTVLRAGGGRDALALLDGGERVDLVITDLGMPGMTGWELARALRTRWPDLPVGLISGWSSADFSAEEASHVAFVVAKPYTLGALRTALAPFRPRRQR